ncbi:MAG TPA: glycosyltransferase family 4 protein [Thermoanaerobaculia bacterium]|nr:glycosyltransferase family 4 protein [Thermoanaerobaculia bacterium]
MTARAQIAVLCRGAAASGGVAQVALRHCAELAREFGVTLISDSERPRALDERVGFERVTPPSFALLRRFAHAPAEVAFARAARQRLFALGGVSFVIAHGDVAAVLAGLRFRRARGVPFGFVTHGDMGERPADAFDWRLAKLYRWAEKRSARTADLVIALGPAMAGHARARGATDDRIAIVPNGVGPRDIGVDDDHPRRFDGVPLSLLFVGRLAVEKGIGDLLEAMRMLPDVRLSIAGQGPLEASLPRLPNVTFLGAVPRAQLGALYRAADVLVAPSISEALPMVVLEALAAGTPVVACPAGDIPLVVRDGENGLLVPPRDPQALANAIRSLAADRGRLRALAANARPSVLPRFSWEATGALLRDAVRARLRPTIA